VFQVYRSIKSLLVKNIVRLLLLTLFFVGAYVGIQTIDVCGVRFVQSQLGKVSSAVKTTDSHFRNPDFSVFRNGKINDFLDKITKHKLGLLAQKKYYVMLLGGYLFLSCCVIIFILGIEYKKESNECKY